MRPFVYHGRPHLELYTKKGVPLSPGSSAYARGCRCDECRLAQAAACRKWKTTHDYASPRQREVTVKDGSVQPETPWGYYNVGTVTLAQLNRRLGIEPPRKRRRVRSESA